MDYEKLAAQFNEWVGEDEKVTATQLEGLVTTMAHDFDLGEAIVKAVHETRDEIAYED